MSIVRKNLKATKGKKRWRRNIDISELINEREEIRKRDEADVKVQEKLKNQQQLFYVDNAPTTMAQKVRHALDPNRFKKNPSKRIQSKNEEKLILKKVKALENAPVSTTNEDLEKTSTSGDDMVDLWDDMPRSKPSKMVKLESDIKVAAVITPHAGQSYNPSFKEHKNLLNEVVEEEAERHRLRLWKSKKHFRVLFQKRKIRPSSFVDRLVRDEVRAKKIKNKQDTDIMHIKSIMKNIKKVDEDLEKKLDQKRETAEKDKKELEEGYNRKARRLGKKKYVMRATDFQMDEELVPNLRSITSDTSLIRERFDSYFRRNLLDTADPFARKKKNRRLPLYKYHNVDRSRDDHDNDLGILG